MSFSLSSLSPLSHTKPHYKNALTPGDFAYFSVSLSSPQTLALDKSSWKAIWIWNGGHNENMQLPNGETLGDLEPAIES